MATRGRPPKPTQLKLLHGDDKINPSRINRDEPKPPTDGVEPPGHLSAPAREIWDAVAPSMIRIGVLTRWDVPIFAELCEALIIARVARLNAMKEASGRYVPEAGRTSPTAVWMRSIRIVTDLGSRFGMTPSDRSRLTMPQERRGSADDLLSG